MEKVRPWCGQRLNRGRLQEIEQNRTEHLLAVVLLILEYISLPIVWNFSVTVSGSAFRTDRETDGRNALLETLTEKFHHKCSMRLLNRVFMQVVYVGLL